MKETRELSVVIPNFNGEDMLKKCLPSVVTALENGCTNYEIMIIDDSSTDGSKSFLQREYPKIRVLETGGRKGQEFALNLGFQNATYDLVLQLDSDVRIKSDFCEYVFKHFSNNTTFAIAPAVYNWEGQNLLCGQAEISFKKGMFSISLSPHQENGAFSLFASGCASVLCKQKVLALGGYDVMYESAHMDEIDLAYRAWKSGWKIIHEPKCVAFHHVSATRSQVFLSRHLAYMKERNQWLFTWKNVTDPVMIAKHFTWIPPHLTAAIFKRNAIMLTSFFGAMRKLVEILKSRRLEKRNRRVLDREILELFSH